jgi:hypothetical protein
MASLEKIKLSTNNTVAVKNIKPVLNSNDGLELNFSVNVPKSICNDLFDSEKKSMNARIEKLEKDLQKAKADLVKEKENSKKLEKEVTDIKQRFSLAGTKLQSLIKQTFQ